MAHRARDASHADRGRAVRDSSLIFLLSSSIAPCAMAQSSCDRPRAARPARGAQSRRSSRARVARLRSARSSQSRTPRPQIKMTRSYFANRTASFCENVFPDAEVNTTRTLPALPACTSCPSPPEPSTPPAGSLRVIFLSRRGSVLPTFHRSVNQYTST